MYRRVPVNCLVTVPTVNFGGNRLRVREDGRRVIRTDRDDSKEQ